MLLIPLAIVCCTSCDQESKSEVVAADFWYSAWITDRDGRAFHSEILLDPGKSTTVEIPSEAPLVVGFVVEKGYEICKEHTYIYMGNEDDRRAIGASPGSWTTFEPKNGMIRACFENGSSIPTRVAIYTKKP